MGTEKCCYRFHCLTEWRGGKSRKEIHKRLQEVWGEKAPGYSTVKRWIQKFEQQGDLDHPRLKDEPRSGRPRSSMTPENIANVPALQFVRQMAVQGVEETPGNCDLRIPHGNRGSYQKCFPFNSRGSLSQTNPSPFWLLSSRHWQWWWIRVRYVLIFFVRCTSINFDFSKVSNSQNTSYFTVFFLFWDLDNEILFHVKIRLYFKKIADVFKWAHYFLVTPNIDVIVPARLRPTKKFHRISLLRPRVKSVGCRKLLYVRAAREILSCLEVTGRANHVYEISIWYNLWYSYSRAAAPWLARNEQVSEFFE